jgi:hypothetical protein
MRYIALEEAFSIPELADRPPRRIRLAEPVPDVAEVSLELKRPARIVGGDANGLASL